MKAQTLRYPAATLKPLLIAALTIAIVVLVFPAVARAQMAAMRGMADSSHVVGTAGSAEMGGDVEGMAHMRMTTLEPIKPGDSARAAAIVVALRQALEPYADYHQALADGYRIFLPRVPQRVYHFTSPRQGFMSLLRFNPVKPSSLLYEKTGDSTYRLVGAMYTAPRRATLAKLDKRVPLSIAQWHAHTNWCLPKAGLRAAREQVATDRQPMLGRWRSITTEAECSAAGGRFFPQVFGWMVHVYPFASDPSQIWHTEDMH